jgi:hypothetical protein
MAFEITQLYLYRLRYVLGYGAIFLAVIGLLTFAGFFIPGGLSSEEMAAVVKSDSLSLVNFSSLAVIDLPFHFLQAVSINLLGVSEFSIKLPSLILGLLSAVGMVVLLTQWFKNNIAVLASLIAITTGQFLFVAQSGTPGIMYIFWPVALLLLGTLITKGVKLQFLWRALFFIIAALSLYTPLSIYPLVAMILAALLHPHLRNVVKKLLRVKLLFAMILGLAILSPLAYGIATQPVLGLALLGIPDSLPDFVHNGATLIKQYLFFWQPSTTTLMTPVFGLGSMLLIIYGLYQMFKTRETTQSYLITTWLICLVPVLIINPSFTTVTFLPLLLLLTTGLDRLIAYWYRLFPMNPYARFAGLVPLVILVIGLIGSGLDRYIYGYYYQPETATHFSKDLRLMPRDIDQLVVSRQELPFYTVVDKHSDSLTVTSDSPTENRIVVTEAAAASFSGYSVERIVTSASAENSDRFYIYKKDQE